jgi:KaiC/GvpD/RAD55 family RecA-like ATPase
MAVMENTMLAMPLVVMKARGSRHSNQFHEFCITDRGLDLVKA